MNPTLYMPIPAIIERIKDETPDIKTFTIRPDEPVPFAAGQFVELAVPGIGEGSPTGYTPCKRATNSECVVPWAGLTPLMTSMAAKS
jgi:ferredoxin-NADP reductase